jgi:hypothetical protein
VTNTLAYFVTKQNLVAFPSLKQVNILLVTLLQGTNTLAYLISLKVTEEECSFHCIIKIILVANNLAYFVTKQNLEPFQKC